MENKNEISLLKLWTNRTPVKNIDFSKLVECMRTDTDPTDSLQKLSDNKQKNIQPCMMPLGVYKYANSNNLIKTSGILFFDLDFDDKINSGLTNITKEKILTDPGKYKEIFDIVKGIKEGIKILNYDKPFFTLIKLSFSGLGLHLFVNVDDISKEDLDFYIEHIRKSVVVPLVDDINEHIEYKFKSDKVSDLGRACVISYDPDLFYDKNIIVDKTIFKPEYIKNLKYKSITYSNINNIINNYIIQKSDKDNFIRLVEFINEKDIVLSYDDRVIYQFLYFYIFKSDDFNMYEKIMWNIFEPCQRHSNENYNEKMIRQFGSFSKTINKPDNSTNIGTLYNLLKEYGIVDTDVYEVSVNRCMLESKDTIFDILNNNNKVLIEGMTGIGKTYTIINYLVEQTKTIKDPDNFYTYVMAVPTTIQVEQIVSEYNKIYPDFNFRPVCSTMVDDPDHSKNNQIFISTFDSVYKINNIHTIVVDEAHHFVKSYDFRQEALQGLDDIIHNLINSINKKCIYLTATPDSLLINFKKILIKDNINNKLDLEIIYSNASKTSLINRIKSAGNKKILFVILDKKLQYDLSKKYGLADIINSENKESGLMKNIIHRSMIGENYKLITTTNLICEGININDTEWDEIVFYQVADIDMIRQLSARFRKAKPTIKLIIQKPVNNTDKKMFNRDFIYRIKLNEGITIVNKLNNEKIEFDEYMDGTENIGMPIYEYGIYSEINKKWAVNEWRIKKDIDDIFFNSLYIRRKYFIGFVSEYFNVIKVKDDIIRNKDNSNIIDTDEVYINDLKEFFKLNVYNIDRIVNDKNELVGYIKDFSKTEKDKIYDPNINGWIERYEKLKQLDVVDIDFDIIFNTTRRFNKYIKDVKFQNLIKADTTENAKDKLMKNRINIVNNYLMDNKDVDYNKALKDINDMLLKNNFTFKSYSFTQFIRQLNYTLKNKRNNNKIYRIITK